MADDQTIAERIEAATAEPTSVSVDGLSTANPSVDELIAADRYLKDNAAAKGKRRGLSFAKLKPPGSV